MRSNLELALTEKNTGATFQSVLYDFGAWSHDHVSVATLARHERRSYELTDDDGMMIDQALNQYSKASPYRALLLRCRYVDRMPMKAIKGKLKDLATERKNTELIRLLKYCRNYMIDDVIAEAEKDLFKLLKDHHQDAAAPFKSPV